MMILQACAPYHPFALSISKRSPAANRRALPIPIAKPVIILGISCTKTNHIMPIPKAIKMEILIESYVFKNRYLF